MEAAQGQHGELVTEPIHIEGIRSLYILSNTPFKLSKTSNLSCYKGSVRSGGQSNKINACEAIIVKFNKSVAKTRYSRLVDVDHPCILKALGYGMGINVHRYHSFLALQPFENSFQLYVLYGHGIDQFGRFTEDFIVMISNIIDGIEALHLSGYYCPDLHGDNIAVIRQYDSINAKLWAFRRCNSDEEKDGDWLRLGRMIHEAAKCNVETRDLYDRIKSGELKGKSILEHSALLTVRKKFKNVTTLFFHVQLNYKRAANQGTPLKVSDICTANLETDLDRTMAWAVPQWVLGRCSTRPVQSLRGFINLLRILVQNEVQYMPDEMIKEKMDDEKEMDLDHHLCSCGAIYWAVHRLVAELKLNP